ncbi:IclR family transcriptional regulator [Paenibacillus mendelii]|uniref:IclR family transcriptional regulator n=1 Tax=Paenibacillus mendelii TaxID=206163 RepID=A0ABV6JPG3_9BACL|nr:IclR family transcriptional regulator [Paenibacillus mendelii]MCQ6562288.1 IclR family transcriptional regulator [Paenibacillus mendelii]
MELTKKYNVPALDKAISLIETLSARGEPIGVSELCKLADMPKTSVFFILNTLEQHRYIAKTADGKYELGNSFIHIGLSLLHKLDIRSVARPYMDKLLQETGFCVHLAVLDDGQAMYVEKVDNHSFVKFSTYIGQRQALHASGVGKAIAANIPLTLLNKIVQENGLPARTENTITRWKDFKEALEAIRTQGYAVEDEEGESGIRCIGSAILDHHGQLKAAISITALRADLPIHDIPVIGHKVQQTALEISRQFGYPEPVEPASGESDK